MKKPNLWHMAAAGAAAFWLTQGVRWLIGLKRLPVVEPLQTWNRSNHVYDGHLAIVVPACNEEHTVDSAMRSILAHAPRNALVVAVNDRSTDSTGEILNRLACQDDRLMVCHVRHLPRGWLGKTHAMTLGTRVALNRWGVLRHDDWFLFTDADVVYRDGGIEAALSFARTNGVDHLTAFPHLVVRGFWEKVFVSAFTILFGIRYRIWEVNNPRSSAYVGIGAFNLVRAEAYERMGTHRRLALEVGDDVCLGREMRRSGARQIVANGYHMASVRWQHSLSGLISGLEKNAFSGVDYSLVHLVVFATAGTLLLASPFAGVFVTRGWARAANLSSLGMLALLYASNKPQGGPSWWYFLTYPLGTMLFLVTIWRSAIIILLRGGVSWRDSFYPLKELRARPLPAPIQGECDPPGSGQVPGNDPGPDEEAA